MIVKELYVASQRLWQRGEFVCELIGITDITSAIAIDDTIVDKTHVLADKEWMQISGIKSVSSNTEVNQYWHIRVLGQLVYPVVLFDECVKVTARNIVAVAVWLLEYGELAIVNIQHTRSVIVRHPAVR